MPARRRGVPGASSARCQKPMRQAGRKRPRPPQDAVSGRQQLPGRGAAALRSRPRLPYGFWLGGTGTPRSRGVHAYVRPLTLPPAARSGNPGVAGAAVPGKVPCRLPSPPLPRSENPLNRGHHPDAPVSPAPSPPPGRSRLQARSLPRPFPAGDPRERDRRGRFGGGRGYPEPAPPAPSRRPPRATALWAPHSHKCCFQLIAGAGEGRGPGRRPRPEAGAPRVGRRVPSAAACTGTTPQCKFEM